MDILLAIIIGLLFGFTLQKSGAANPDKIINMFLLKDFHLMKVIFLALGISSGLLFIFLGLDIVDSTHLSVKPAHVGVIIGGGIFGLGWIISGFCPGTSLAALGAGHKDAWSFIIGALLGALAFTLVYYLFKNTILLSNIAGKSTLATTGNTKFDSLSSLPSIVVAGMLAIGFIIIAWKLPSNKKS